MKFPILRLCLAALVIAYLQSREAEYHGPPDAGMPVIGVISEDRQDQSRFLAWRFWPD